MPRRTAPPLRIRWNLWRDVRLFGRSRQASEQWHRFSVAAGILAIVGLLFNAVGMFLFFVAGGWWITLDKERAYSGEVLCPGNDTCLAMLGNSAVQTALTIVGWIITVCVWVLLPIAGANVLVQVTWYLRSGTQRAATWHESLFWEYAGVGKSGAVVMAPPGRHELVAIGDVDWARRTIRRIGGRPATGFGPDRLVHARRWAIAREAQSLTSALVALGGMAVSLGLVLWHFGAVDAAREVGAFEAARVLVVDYAWRLTDAVPALEITETLRWDRPDLFAEDRTWSVILLALKILLFLPVAAYVATILRGRRDDTVPTVPHADDPVIRALYARLLKNNPMPLYYFALPGGWPALYENVAADLTAAGHEGWTPAAVAEHVHSVLARGRQP